MRVSAEKMCLAVARSYLLSASLHRDVIINSRAGPCTPQSHRSPDPAIHDKTSIRDLGQDSRTFNTLIALVLCPATAYVRVCSIVRRASHPLLACEPSYSMLRVCRVTAFYAYVVRCWGWRWVQHSRRRPPRKRPEPPEQLRRCAVRATGRTPLGDTWCVLFGRHS